MLDQNSFSQHDISGRIQKYHLLWKVVISQAIADVNSNCKKAESKVAKQDALSWLSSSNRDFRYICVLANCNPEQVRSKIQPTLVKQHQKSKILIST